MRAKLSKREEIATGIFGLEFETLGETVNFEPGQFFSLNLLDPPESDPRGNSRYFGFNNLPGQNIVQMITKAGPSAYKKYLLQMPQGTEVEIDKIQGLPILPKEPNQPVVFVCSNIGIAPVISVLRNIKAKDLNYNITLVYVFNDRASAPFITELESLAKERSDFKLIETVNFDRTLIQQNFPNLNENLYCPKGEPKFVVSAARTLEGLGVAPKMISMEIFTGY